MIGGPSPGLISGPPALAAGSGGGLTGVDFNRVQIHVDHEAIPYVGRGSGTFC